MVCQVSQVRADQAVRSTLLDVFGQHKHTQTLPVLVADENSLLPPNLFSNP